MNCTECGGKLEQQQGDPREWDCPDCGTEFLKGEDGELGICGNHSVDNESERLSVWDAADIYLSNGCDEDYMFGYTHEELMKASGN